MKKIILKFNFAYSFADNRLVSSCEGHVVRTLVALFGKQGARILAALDFILNNVD